MVRRYKPKWIWIKDKFGLKKRVLEGGRVCMSKKEISNLIKKEIIYWTQSHFITEGTGISAKNLIRSLEKLYTKEALNILGISIKDEVKKTYRDGDIEALVCKGNVLRFFYKEYWERLSEKSKMKILQGDRICREEG